VTRTEALLLTQVIALGAVAVGIVYAYEPRLVGRTLGLIAPPVVAPQQVSSPIISAEPELEIVADAQAPEAWVALEQLAYITGPWRSPDGAVLVSVLPKDPKAPPGAPDGMWRLSVARERQHTITCTVYEGLQFQGEMPWRMAYCRGLEPDPAGPAEAAKVSLFRLPGQEAVRLVLGGELDVEIVQVQ
jgi:hypothetical protein